jgi:hypothetical protein
MAAQTGGAGFVALQQGAVTGICAAIDY